METRRDLNQWLLLGHLLPIREAYEWKPNLDVTDFDFQDLASNSWSVWMETRARGQALVYEYDLLPIREAYEWKRKLISTRVE